ncbi:hypothetical protein [Paenibacillus ihumii]|uniref:hypothetical protein n=1 Tax=Paenibacillus ihumii TaxID=687436 RepID=UPI0006D8163F|nr:hypothetical protein [Paenibacillus ihumii]
MQRDNDAEEYTELFLSFSNRMEAWLRKALIATLAGLCLCQLLLRIPALRAYIASADRYEGVAIDRAGER